MYITYFLHKKLSAKGNKTRAVDCSPIRAAASAVSPSLSPAVLNRKEKDEMEKGTRKTEVETRRLGAGKNGYGQVAIEYGPRPKGTRVDRTEPAKAVSRSTPHPYLHS